MYSWPAVGLVEPIMVKALPATPAMPQPMPEGETVYAFCVDSYSAGHCAVCS